MNFIQRLFKRHKLDKIFTPNRVAKLTYINRGVIETDFEKYLSIPGRQIIVYGHSGSGKSSLVRNKLHETKWNFIRTHCERKTTFEDILLQAFDELNKYYTSEYKRTISTTISSEVQAKFNDITAKLNSSSTISDEEKRVRIVSVQLTPQKLAEFLGEINGVWLIEDFHKVKAEEKTRIADVIKIFIDSSNDFGDFKIVCIGAVGTARELIELDSNLNTRVSELFVPLLNDNEIRQIIQKGAKLLNIKMTPTLVDKIVYYSNNLATVCHDICYDLCYHRGIKKTRIFPIELEESDFREAVEAYVRKYSDTFSKLYETISASKFGWYVLKSFDNLEEEYLESHQLNNRIPEEKRPQIQELEDFLLSLGSSDFNEIIRYHRNSNKFSISNPFFKAYLKMKFALEKTELQEKKQKRKNKSRRKFDIEQRRQLVIDDDFFQTYYQFLDNIQLRHIRIQSKIEKEIRNISLLELKKETDDESAKDNYHEAKKE